MQSASKHSGKAKRAEAQAEPSRDVEQMRMELALKVAHLAFDKYWRTCRQPACRRRRLCAAPRVECTNAPPRRPLTPEEDAAVRADIWRTFRRRLAEIERAAG